MISAPIKCPCGKQVSNAARTCAKCNRPMCDDCWDYKGDMPATDAWIVSWCCDCLDELERDDPKSGPQP